LLKARSVVVFDENTLRFGAPFIEDNVARVNKTVSWTMHKAKCLAILGIANEGAEEGLSGKFAAMLIRYVNISSGPKDTKR
jgi:hypothetical protein